MRQQINSRTDLVRYCLRKLGAPVIKINVTDQQIDDRINDTIDMYIEFHMDGSYRKIYTHKITKNDINNGYITTPDTIVSIMSVLSNNNSSTFINMSNIQVQMYFSDLLSNTLIGGDISGYTQSMSYLNMMNQSLPNDVDPISTYQIHENKLIIPSINLSKMTEGSVIALECYMCTDPDEAAQIFNDYWVKQYATAQIKLQWANNISKFSSVNMPGGGTLNGDALMQQATQEIQDLEIKLKDQFSLPPMAFMY